MSKDEKDFLEKSGDVIKKGTDSLVKSTEKVAKTIWKGDTRETTKTTYMEEQPFTPIEYEILGNPSFAELIVNLKEKQIVYSESGALVWMDGNVEVDSMVKGGAFSALKRVFSGETIFQNAYFTSQGEGKVSLSPSFPGDILSIKTEKNVDWIVSRNSFLAATENINVTASWQGLRSFFGRGKTILTRAEVYGEGILWLGIFGSTTKHELKSGQELIVDGINVAAFQAGMEYEIDTGGNMKFFFFGGKGFVFKFKGPGVVYTQSRSIEAFKSTIDRWAILTRNLFG